MRPQPTPEDFAAAEKLADEHGADRGPNWARDHRANAVHQFAMLIMAKRLDAEHRTTSNPQPMLAMGVGQEAHVQRRRAA